MEKKWIFPRKYHFFFYFPPFSQDLFKIHSKAIWGTHFKPRSPRKITLPGRTSGDIPASTYHYQTYQLRLDGPWNHTVIMWDGPGTTEFQQLDSPMATATATAVESCSPPARWGLLDFITFVLLPASVWNLNQHFAWKLNGNEEQILMVKEWILRILGLS